MKRYWIALCLAVALVMVVVAYRNVYYRGVYDACIHYSAANGQVTTFDLLQCKELTAHARAGDWYGLESLQP